MELPNIEKSPLILDGGLATELEKRGFDIHHSLWSAKVLLDNPHAIQTVHEDYLSAGAECLTTASYQASYPGFAKAGLSEKQSTALLLMTIELALQAREAFLMKTSKYTQPLIAASIGPYGAYLNDGSEYRGNYGLKEETLINFHRQRFEVLSESKADLLAIETIPCFAEAHALLQLLQEHPQAKAWFSFACQDASHLCSGELVQDAVQLLSGQEQVVAIGVNCIHPQWIPGLIANLLACSDKPIIVYPNSGEIWDEKNETWNGVSDSEVFAKNALDWFAAGAQWIGGCCRTGPEHIRRLAKKFPDPLAKNQSVRESIKSKI